ncbi:MAG: serine hydrolase [Bacteroidetes bacterium]|nr:MAG: serine hydrolase [Bacteroidota bacterium]
MKYSQLIVFLFFMAASCMPEEEPPLVQLSKDLSEIITDSQGTYAVAFADLKTGDTLFINGHESFHAASTMKVPVMIELYKQAQEAKFSLDDSILVKTEFVSIVDGSLYTMDVDEDSETILYEKVDSMLPIRELMYHMITKSSNLATNILIELVDAKKVTATMRDLGAPDIEVLRGVEDLKAFDSGLSNSTTAYDLMKILEAIGMEKIINEEACGEMMNVMFDQQFNKIIPSQLPSEVKVAHKTGSITGVQHDAGIIVLPTGHKYVLVLLSKELEDKDKGVETLSLISKKVYDFVVADKDQMR